MASNPISTLPAAQTVVWTGRSSIASGADGYLDVKNSAGTGFTGVRLGGATSSFPMLKRSSAALHARLADDSGYAALDASVITAQTSLKFWDATNSNTLTLSGDDNDLTLLNTSGVAGRLVLGDVVASNNVTTGGTGYIGFSLRSALSCPSDGYLTLTNAALNNFTGLQFGGTSSSYPMLKRSSATLQARLADDSGYAALSAGNLLAGDATNQLFTVDTVTSGSPTMTGARIRLSTTEAPTEFYDIYTGEDGINTSTHAMYIVPSRNPSRLFFGRSGKTFILDMQYVASIDNHPYFITTDSHTWGGSGSSCIGRQLGSLTIDGESVNTVYNVSSTGSKNSHHFLAVSGAWTNPTATSVRATITSDRNFFLWNTYTSSTNYERGVFGWASNVLKIGTQKAASGTARDLSLVTNDTQRMKIDASGGVFLYGLPTSDPGVSGQLYTSSGALMVSP